MSDFKAADLEQLLNLYEQVETGAPRPERRRHPRTAARTKVAATIEPVAPGQAPVQATVADLSRSGVGLASPVPFSPDTQLMVTFTLASRPVRATCRVANCRPLSIDSFHVGLEFHKLEHLPAAPAPVAGTVPSDPGHVDQVAQRLKQLLGS